MFSFPTFSVEPKQWESLHLVFPISLHLVSALIGKFYGEALPFFPAIRVTLLIACQLFYKCTFLNFFRSDFWKAVHVCVWC